MLGVTLALAQAGGGDAKQENQASIAAAARGDYGAARQHASLALSLARRSRDTRTQSQALNNLATAEVYSGEYVAADQLLQKALSLSRGGAMPDLEAEQLTNLGGIQFYQGRYDEAFATYSQADSVAAAGGTEAWVGRRRKLIRTNLAALHQRLGQNEAALALYRSMLGATDQLKPVERAQLLTNLGVCYRRLGDPVKALETYGQAQALYSEARHLDGELGVGKNRGIVLALDLGELEQARRVFLDNRDRATRAGNRREALQANLYAAECAYRAGMTAEARSEFTEAARLAGEMGAKEEEWKALYGLGRTAGRAGDTAAAVASLSAAAAVIETLRSTVAADARADFFADKRAVYDALVDLRFDEASPAELFGWLERGRARAFQDRIGGARPDLAALQGRLDERTTVLLYWRSRNKGGVVWITKGSAGKRRFELPPESIASYRRMLMQPASDWRPVAREIGRVLVEGTLSPRVIVSPSGDLAGIPFESLEVAGKPLIETAEVAYAPAAAVLVRPDSGTSRTLPWKLEFAGFGDPRPGPGSGSSPGWLPGSLPVLPAAEGEVRRAAAALGGRSAMFLGLENRRQAFLDSAARSAPVMHMATHAISDPELPERSRLVFSGGESLYLRQLNGIDLRSTQLAVLSACDTEAGRVVEGEGVQTFGRALLAGGVRSAVTSMWRVEDAASAQLMAVLYRELSSGLGTSAALRKAKLEMMRSGGERSHPAYWAGFVVNGDGSAPVPLPIGRWPFIVAGAVIAGLAAARYARAPRREVTPEPVPHPAPHPAP